MTRIFLVAVLFAAAGAIFFATRGENVRAAGPCATANGQVSGPESQLLAGINAWRGSALGQPAMGNSASANFAAQIHAEALVNGTASGHNDSLGRSWATRLQDCGYTQAYIVYGSGEAVETFPANSPGSQPSDALAAMTSSQPGHQSGVQAPVPWECSGVGYASNPGGAIKHAWVVVVASAPSSASCPQSTPGGTSTTTSTATNTPTSTPTRTPTPTPTPRADGATVVLHAGWNLVSLPSGPVAQVLYRAEGCYSAVYQQQGDRWLRFAPGVPAYANNLQTLNGGAFWVEGTAENCGLIQL